MSNTKIKNQISKKLNVSLEDLMTKFGGNKSAVMRYLDSQPGSEFSRARIADFMGVRYQHVRNVLNMPLKKEVETVVEASEDVKTTKATK